MTAYSTEYIKETVHDFFKQTGKLVEDDTELFVMDIMDSMDLLMLLSFIEDKLGVDIPQETMTRENFETILNIVKTIEHVGQNQS